MSANRHMFAGYKVLTTNVFARVLVARRDGGLQVVEHNHAGQLRVSALLSAAETGHVVQRARSGHNPGTYRCVYPGD